MMKTSALFLIICLISMPLLSQSTSETRTAIMSIATTEAGTTYYSAPTDSDALITNVNHLNYLKAIPYMSPLYLALEKAGIWTDKSLQGSWNGAPYCYGNYLLQSNCQDLINNGGGIGASKAQYEANNNSTAWAAGIDCSNFVWMCYNASNSSSYYNTTELSEDDGEGKELQAWQMKPADLFLYPGVHVILFGYWSAPYSQAWVTHADGNNSWERVHNELWSYNAFGNYIPHAHPDFIDDYNTITYLMNFTPYVLANGICVDFSTRYEENASHYLLQRHSVHNDALIPVAKIPAKGSGTEYSFMDYDGTKDHYYRIVEVEESGVRNILEYSHVFESKPEWDIDISTRDLRDINSIRIETSSILQKYRDLAKSPAMTMIQNYEWVAIYPDSFESDVDSLIEWRNLRGLCAIGISIEDVNSTYGSIESYIQHLWQTQNSCLEYICLVGGACVASCPDYDLLPIDIFDDGGPLKSNGTTAYTSDFEVGDINSDGYPEIAVGRIPAETIYDVASYVNKVLTYEDTTPGDWENEITYFIDAFDHNSCSGPVAKSYAEILKETIPSNFNCHYMLFNDSTYADTVTYYPDGLTFCLMQSKAINEFNDGRSLVLGFGNGANPWNCMYWMLSHPHHDCEGYFCTDSLSTNEIFPFFIGAGCELGDLAIHQDTLPRPLVKDLLFDSERGIIGAFAPSSGSWLAGNYKIAKTILQYLYEWGSPSVGYACMSAQKAVMLGEDIFDSTARSYNFFGDPAIKIAGSIYDNEGTPSCMITHSYVDGKSFHFVCPSGDIETLLVDLDMEFDFNPRDIAANEISIDRYPPDSSFVLFSGGPITADSSATSENLYNTTITHEYFGGCGCNTLNVRLNGDPIGALILYVKTCDLNHDASVTISDYSIFIDSYNTGLGDSNYNHCCDYTGDDACSLTDFAFFSEHYGHYYSEEPQGMMMASSPAPSNVEVSLIIKQEEDEKDKKRLLVAVRLENIECFSDLCIGLTNDNSYLEYMKWIPNPEFAGRSIAAPVINNGKEVMFIGVSTHDPIKTIKEAVIGTIEYAIDADKELILTDKDYNMIIGDVLFADGTVERISNTELTYYQGQTSIYGNYLSCNYPNPFNPRTMIEYSIAEDSFVNLTIYNVAGQHVRTLVNESQKRNSYRISWDGKDKHGNTVASGVYFYRLQAGQFTAAKKLVILR